MRLPFPIFVLEKRTAAKPRFAYWYATIDHPTLSLEPLFPVGNVNIL